MQSNVALKSNHGLSILLLFGWGHEIHIYHRSFFWFWLVFDIISLCPVISCTRCAEMRKWKWILGKGGVRILSNTVKTSQKLRMLSSPHFLRLRDSDCKSLSLSSMTWFAFLNLLGMATKPLNRSRCLFLCLLFVHAMSPPFSGQLSEKIHIYVYGAGIKSHSVY